MRVKRKKASGLGFGSPQGKKLRLFTGFWRGFGVFWGREGVKREAERFEQLFPSWRNRGQNAWRVKGEYRAYPFKVAASSASPCKSLEAMSRLLIS